MQNQIVYLSIKDIKPYENNPRLNDDAVQYVAESIKEFGFKQPLVLDKDNIIVCGHTRFKAAKKLKLKQVPCIIASDLTDEQIKGYRLADNKTAEYAEWDNDLLQLELDGIFDIDMSGFGFELDIEEEPKEVEEDNYEVELPAEPKAKRGDIYQLGNHFLMCGDSTNDDIAKLMNGNKADLVLTDPPYNMAYKGAGNTAKEKRESNVILNDNMSNEKFEQFLIDVNTNIYTHLKEGSSFYIFYKELGEGVFITSLKEAGLTFKQELIWVKNSIVLGGSKYQSMYEPCLFGCKGKSIKAWYTGRKERSVIEHIDLMNEEELKAAVKELLAQDETDIIRVDKNLKNDLHPTMKPIKLLAKLINNSSQPNDIVLDLFGGSGSTLIACEQLNRRCYINELDEKYVDVIIDRWEQLTGEKAVLLNVEEAEREQAVFNTSAV